MPELGIYSRGKRRLSGAYRPYCRWSGFAGRSFGGRVYAANGRLFVQSDRSMQLPVYKVTGQIVKIMNVVEGLNTDYLPCGVYVVAGQVVAVTAGNK